MVPYETVKTYAKRTFLGLVIFLAGLYAVDYLVVRSRATSASGSAFGTATVYYATTLKNGKVELYYQNPIAVTCVNSLFPHLGYSTCWSLRRTPVKPVD